MGTLTYGDSGSVISFDDRALMHLQIVICTKLRRRDNFVFSWTDAGAVSNGRSAIWLDPATTLYFRYFGSRVPTINREWIEILMRSANSAGGLVYVTEPPPQTAGERSPA